MILDNHAFDIKDCMVMFILVYLNVEMLSQKIVSLLLCATSFRAAIRHLLLLKQPNIRIAAGSMIRHRIIEAKAITLENHQLDIMLCKESCKFYYDSFLSLILLLNLLHSHRPLNLLHLRRLLLGWDFTLRHRLLNIIPHNRSNVLLG